MKKEKEICVNFAVTPQTAKVTDTVDDKCLVKMKKTLNMHNKIFRERSYSHNFIKLLKLLSY